MSVRFRPLPPSQLVELVNDWGSVPLRTGNRDLPAVSAMPGLGRRRADVVAVADRLHAVFESTDEDERIGLVNAMLAESEVRPVLARADGAVWSVPRARDALLAGAALALRAHLAEHPQRLGICADRQCADVYVDASPTGHRRFCSVTCQNRTRVAAFRERRRTG